MGENEWITHAVSFYICPVLEALQAIRKTNNQPHLNLVN